MKELFFETGKQFIPTCNIMGVQIAVIDMEGLIRFTERNIKDLTGKYICVSNVHTTVMSFEDPSYCAIQNGAVLAIPDGGPLSSLGKHRGYKNMKRTTGTAYLEEVLKISAENGYRHFFYGSTNEVLEKLRCRINKLYPEVQIVGMHSPPFRTMTKEEDLSVIEEINAAAPDFVWVSLGAPKQERWMAAHQGKISGLMVGVGAAFDFLSGVRKRAPEWMQESNMEWFYRLLLEPKRLFDRYKVTNSKFIWHAVIRGK